jgi:hypothetical protein
MQPALESKTADYTVTEALSAEDGDNIVTKALRPRGELTKPEGLSVNFLSLAAGESYRGRCRIDHFSSPYGIDEPIAVLPPPYDVESYNLLLEHDRANLFRALVELSERTCPTDDLGDEALGYCYSPERQAVEMVEQFVSSFGLLHWELGPRNALGAHHCAGPQGKTCDIELSHQGEIDKGTERLAWVHYFFLEENPELPFANAVSWILQEALMLRRAARLADALQRYRSGGSGKVVASLWRRAGGHWRLFDSFIIPFVRPSYRVFIAATEAYLEDLLNKHLDVKLQGRHAHFPAEVRASQRDSRRTKLTAQLLPDTPLAAAWLQLFENMRSSKSSGRICHECRTLFDPTRVDQAFCSPRCSARSRQRAFRLRRLDRTRARH